MTAAGAFPPREPLPLPVHGAPWRDLRSEDARGVAEVPSCCGRRLHPLEHYAGRRPAPEVVGPEVVGRTTNVGRDAGSPRPALSSSCALQRRRPATVAVATTAKTPIAQSTLHSSAGLPPDSGRASRSESDGRTPLPRSAEALPLTPVSRERGRSARLAHIPVGVTAATSSGSRRSWCSPGDRCRRRHLRVRGALGVGQGGA